MTASDRTVNLYILVEGTTERSIYPKWLMHLAPYLTQQKLLKNVVSNDYYLFSSGGIPSVIQDIEKCVLDIKEHGNIDYLLVCLDAEELTLQQRLDEVNAEIVRLKNTTKTTIIPVIQDPCIETWLLGNPKMCGAATVNKDFQECLSFYNVRTDDPEQMGKPDIDIFNTRAQYHEYYLQQMFLNKNLSYKKGKSKEVAEHHYLQALQSRVQTTGHLSSLRYFFDLLSHLQK